LWHLISEEPYLFVLDGLERILIAYHRMDANHVVMMTTTPGGRCRGFAGYSRTVLYRPA